MAIIIIIVRMTEVRIGYVNAEAHIGLNPFFSLVIVPSFLGPRASIDGSDKPSKSRRRNTHKEGKGNKAKRVIKRVIRSRLILMFLYVCASLIYYVIFPDTVSQCTVAGFVWSPRIECNRVITMD